MRLVKLIIALGIIVSALVSADARPRGSNPSTTWNGKLSQFNSPSCPTHFAYLNFFKCAGRWTNVTGGAGIDLTRLDADGYPTSLPSGGVSVNVDIPAFAGTWLLLWDGGGTMGSSGSVVSGSYSTSGVELNLGTGGGTSQIRVLAVNSSSDYPHNIRLVLNNGTDLAALNAGNVFRADYISLASEWGIVRVMDPGCANVSTVAFWADRKPESYYTYNQYYFPPNKIVPIANVTYDGVSKYSVTWSGQTGPLTDKVQFIAQVPTSGTTTTTNLNGTGDIPNRNIYGGSRSSITSARWMVWTYDILLNVWMVDDLGGASGTGLGACAPEEVLLKEAVALRAHIWYVPGPYQSSYNGGVTDYVTQRATLAKNTLAPLGLKSIFECGPNETWNNGFNQTLYAYAQQDARNGGSSAYTITGATAGATTTLTIGTNTTLVGSLLVVANVGGLTGFGTGTNTRVLSKPSSTQIEVGTATTGTYTSGGTATPSLFDVHNWYGIACSYNAQAVEAVFGSANKNITYESIAGFQMFGGVSALGSNSGTSARIQSPFLTVNGNTSLAAYNYLTHISGANYFWPQLDGSNAQTTIRESQLAFEYITASAPRQTAILDEYANSTAYSVTPVTITNITPGNPTIVTVDRTDLFLTGDSGAATETVSMTGIVGNIGGTLNRSTYNSPAFTVLSKTATTVTLNVNTTGLVYSSGGAMTTRGSINPNITNVYENILPQFFTYMSTYSLGFKPYEGGSGPDRITQNGSNNIKGITNGATTVVNVGANSWDYLYNTVGLTGMTTTISGIAAGTLATLLNGNSYTILSATSTTITINVDTSAVSAWVSGGLTTYDGSMNAVNTLRNNVNFTPAVQALTVLNATTMRSTCASCEYPSEFNFNTQQNYSVFFPNYFAQTLTPYRYLGMQQYN